MKIPVQNVYYLLCYAWDHVQEGDAVDVASEEFGGLVDLFAANLRLHADHRCTYVHRDDARVVATVTIRPPDGIHHSVGALMRAGLLGLAVRRGVGAIRRMLDVSAAFDAVEEEVSHGQRHWYVHMMAVHPSVQGKGLGSSLLTEALAATADLSELPISLATQKKINLDFYGRFGFEVVDERSMSGAPGRSDYVSWSMIRQPLGQSPK